MYDATRGLESLYARVMADNIHGKEWRQMTIEKNKTFSTFERSITGRVKNTTDLDPPHLSAPKSIFFLPKKLTHTKVCDINDAVVQTPLLAWTF
jgi:hypothetical protein